jgi:hypothetical protein
MNERIKALADQAANYAATMALPLGETGDNLFVQRFSELIIQDCIECCVVVTQAAVDIRDTARDDEFEYLYGREDAASLCKSTIQKHFGEGK